MLRRDADHLQVGTSPGVVIADRPGLYPFLRGLDGTRDFAALSRALGAHGAKAHTLADLTTLEEWLATGEDGVFVLDVAISQKVIAEFMAASLDAGKRL